MTTEKTEGYFLQWRILMGWKESTWEDYYGPEGDDTPDEMLMARDRYRKIDRDFEYRVVHRAIEITVIDDV